MLKLIVLIIISTITLFIKDWRILLTLSISIILALSLAKSNKQLSLRITPLLVIGLFVIIFQLIFNTSIGITSRIIMGTLTATKITILSLLVFFYSSTTSPSEIVSAFSFLPKKISLMITITFSLIPAVLHESQKILLVQNTRGYNSKNLNIFKSVIPLIIPLLHRILRRAEQIALVLQTRGYDDE